MPARHMGEELSAVSRTTQTKLQTQLQPLQDLVDELVAESQRTGYIPDFCSLADWQQERERAAAEAGRATVELALPQEFNNTAGRDLGDVVAHTTCVAGSLS